jgi:hypothetical protein
VGGKSLSRWNMEAGTGVDFFADGDVITGSQAHAGFNNRTLRNVSYNDAYKTMYRSELGGSYAITPNRKVTVQGTYARALGKDIAIGTQNGNELRGIVSDYETYGAEAGVRQYFQPTPLPLVKSMRPYVEGKLGAVHADDIALRNVREVGGAAGPTDLAFYDGGWVPTAAALVGVETPVWNRFTMGIETGVRFTGKQKSDNSGIENGFAQYGGANNGGNRYSIPLTIRGRYRF